MLFFICFQKRTRVHLCTLSKDGITANPKAGCMLIQVSNKLSFNTHPLTRVTITISKKRPSNGGPLLDGYLPCMRNIFLAIIMFNCILSIRFVRRKGMYVNVCFSLIHVFFVYIFSIGTRQRSLTDPQRPALILKSSPSYRILKKCAKRLVQRRFNPCCLQQGFFWEIMS